MILRQESFRLYKLVTLGLESHLSHMGLQLYSVIY
jgi:hypothetical protein